MSNQKCKKKKVNIGNYDELINYNMVKSQESLLGAEQHMENARNNKGRLRDLKHQEDATEYFDNHTVVGPLARLIFQR